MNCFERSSNWLVNANILTLDDEIDEAIIDKMKGHILDSFCSLLHLLSDEDGDCCREVDILAMKIFFLAAKKLADIGLSLTELSAQSATGPSGREMRRMYPDTLYLMEEAFPNDCRYDLYGNDILPLHWSLIVQDHLTIEELRQTMTEEVYREADVKPEVQIVGHIMALAISPNMEVAENLSPMMPRIYHSKDSEKNYPIHVAARYNNSRSFVEYLMQQNPAAIQARGKSGQLPLHLSVLNINDVQYEIFSILLDSYAEAIDLADEHGDTILHLAVMSNNPCIEVIRSILERRPQLSQSVNELGELPLHVHITNDKCHMSIIRMLVESYRDGLSIVNLENEMPAHLAAQYSRIDALEYLLEQYPLAANHICGLHNAVGSSVEVTQIICEKYPESLRIPDDTGLLALHQACMYGGNYGQVALILSSYPEGVLVQDRDGNLPIHSLFSWTWINKDILRFLVRHYPAGVSVTNNAGDTAYSKLCSKLPDETLAHRIMLRVNPDLDMTTYRNLNYKARKLAMFLIFSAMTVDIHLNVFRRLKYCSIELMKKVLSYL